MRATLEVIPAFTWYADLSGVLTFLNERHADYLGLPKDHPLRFGIATGAARDSHILLLHPDDHEEARRVWSTCLRTGSAGEMPFRVRNAGSFVPEAGFRVYASGFTTAGAKSVDYRQHDPRYHSVHGNIPRGQKLSAMLYVYPRFRPNLLALNPTLEHELAPVQCGDEEEN